MEKELEKSKAITDNSRLKTNIVPEASNLDQVKEIRYISYDVCLTVVYKEKTVNKYVYKRHSKDNDKLKMLNSAKDAVQEMINRLENI